MNVGIDLGTTFSVVAVKGQVKLADDYPPGHYLPECDVTIIPTPDGDKTFPSVIAVDPENPDSFIFGVQAKQRAEEGESPVMFSKRWIGSDNVLRLGNRTCTAKEAATEMLRYLKSCAERALGKPVNRAVVTHPAYFDLKQIQETKEAAIAAGFDMSRPEQMLMEPAAAALAYVRNDPRDPLRVMTYDLGGGTFDVTVLERNQGVISMKSFDGNPLLGGYNFDRALVQWILDRLAKAGRVVPYDENNPEDRARRDRLLQLAESVKERLTEQRSNKVYVTISARDILVDSNGAKIQIQERINREEYAALIKDHIQETIERCQTALAKAEMQPQDLDAILLVGGSTYGQWIQEAVNETFGMVVEPYNPDLCVAAGAAIMAEQLPEEAIGADIKVSLDVKPKSSLSAINVAGAIVKPDGSELDTESRQGMRVLLTTPQGEVKEQVGLGNEGQFLFEQIDLLEEEVSNFCLSVVDGRGTNRYTGQFQMEYTPEGGQQDDLLTTLPKSFFLGTADGMKLFAEEGSTLPAKCDIQLRRTWDGSVLDIPVYQEEDEIGKVMVDNIPAEAGEGAPVVLSVEITPRNEIRGKIQILNRNRSVAREAPVRISIPPASVPPLNQLTTMFQEMSADREQKETLSDDPEQRMILAGKGRRLCDKIDRLLKEMEPDKMEIHAALRELARILNPPKEEMDPPRAQFNSTLDACRELLDSLGSDPQVQPLRQVLQRIETEAQNAYSTKNQRKWAIQNDAIAKLYNKLQSLGGAKEDTKQDLPPTVMLKDHFQTVVDDLRAALRTKRNELLNRPDYEGIWKRHCDAIDGEIDKMDSAVSKVDENLEPKQGLAQLQVATRQKPNLQRKIGKLGSAVATQ